MSLPGPNTSASSGPPHVPVSSTTRPNRDARDMLIARALFWLLGLSLVLIGSSLAITFLSQLLWLEFGVTPNVAFWHTVTWALVLALALYRAYASGLVEQVVEAIRNKLAQATQQPSQGNNAIPVTIARFDYKVDDPTDKALFDKFLDTPFLKDNLTNQIVSPADYAEIYLMRIADQLRADYGANFWVETKVIRGSLSITAVLTGLVFISEVYTAPHNMAEATKTYRSWINKLLKTVRREYKIQTNRTAQVTGGVEMAAVPIPAQVDASSSTPSPGSPVNVTNSYMPPQNSRDVSVSVNTNGQHSNGWGCVNSCLLLILVVIAGASAFGLLFIDYGSRIQILDNAVYNFGALVRSIGESLVALGDTILQY